MAMKGEAPPDGARAGASTACCCSTSPSGLSSNAALQRAKRLRRRKGGHTGTLDPFASGLLPLCFGEATKFAQFLLDADKALHSDGALRRDDDDRRRRRRASLAMHPVALAPRRRRSHPARFHGRSRARCRRCYSALKFEGRSLLRLRARRDRSRAHAARHRDPRARLARMAVAAMRCWTFCCSKGTYVRVLAEDIGARTRLRRAPRGAAAHGDGRLRARRGGDA